MSLYSRKAMTVSAGEIKKSVLRTDRFVSVAEPLRMEKYFVSQEHGSEVYYTVFRSSSGLVVTKSDHPIAREVDRLEGVLEPLSVPVLQAVVKAFPQAPTVSLNVVRRPMSLWISALGLVACASLIVGFLATGLGFNGFEGLLALFRSNFSFGLLQLFAINLGLQLSGVC